MDVRTLGLSDDAIAQYRRDGFLFPLPVFTTEEAARAAETVAGIAAAGVPGHPVPWNQKAYLLLPALDAMIRDDRLTDLVARVLGADDLLALSADLFVKPGRTAHRITWHQDVNYWQLEPLRIVTAWVALTPVHRANGGVRYSPGGHRMPLEHVERPDEDNMLTRGQELAVSVPEASAVDVTLAPGEVALHHALVPHASGPNTTDEPRIGFAIRYAPTSVAQTGGPPISARLARGTDAHGNFRLERGPGRALGDDELTEHRRALDPHAATGFSTV
jgi:non-heme Fe2+,alpha-ketoglutarate-dependent halogenase